MVELAKHCRRKHRICARLVLASCTSATFPRHWHNVPWPFQCLAPISFSLAPKQYNAKTTSFALAIGDALPVTGVRYDYSSRILIR